jgi:hypothetical protein
MQRVMVISYRRFGTTYRFQICFLDPDDVKEGSPETSIKSTTTRYVMTQKSAVLEEKACFEIPIPKGHPSPGMAIPVLMEDI